METNREIDHHLQPLMKQDKPYIKDTGNFLEKLKAVEEIPAGAILVTADMVGFCPRIPHDGGFKSFKRSTKNSRTKWFPLKI